MKTKKPFAIIFVVAFSLLYLVYELIYQVHFFNQSYSDFKQRNQIRLLNYATLSQYLLSKDKVENLSVVLKEAINNHDLSQFALAENSQVLSWGPADQKYKFTSDDFQSEGNTLIKTARMERILLKNPPYLLILGTSVDDEYFAIFHVKQIALSLFFDFLIVMGFIILLLRHYFKDIFDILTLFKKGQNVDYSTIHSKSLEADLIVKGLSSYQTQVNDLIRKNNKFANQILPALKSELLSGKIPPYEFNCTLVRTDINGFSYIFNHYPIEDFMQVVNGFFEQSAAIIARYKGYVHELIGDEIIYYFKDEEHDNSSTIALSAVYEINKLAERIHQKVKPSKGYPFHVKSSLAHGKLRYGLQVNNFALAGGILIETVRILSQIQERTVNSVYFGDSLFEQVSWLFTANFEQKVELKGLVGEHSLYSLIEKMSFDNFLLNESQKLPEVVGYYRQNDELIKIFTFLQENSENLDTLIFLEITHALKKFSPVIVDRHVSRSYFSLIQSLRDKFNSTGENRYSYFISSLVLTSIKLFNSEAFDEEMESFFKSLLSFSDKRVVANCIEVFSHFDTKNDDSVFYRLLNETNNRVLANIIVKEGYKAIDKKVLKALYRMLNSKDVFFQASGLYAVGEISRYHLMQNQIYFSTHSKFQKIISLLPKYLNHENEMVRRQALIAKNKLSN